MLHRAVAAGPLQPRQDLQRGDLTPSAGQSGTRSKPDRLRTTILSPGAVDTELPESVNGPVGRHTRMGLKNGLAPAEIGEIATHLAFYTGWPSAIAAVYEIHKAFEEQGVEMPVHAGGSPLELDPQTEAAHKRAVAEHIAPTVPQLAEATDEVLFADLWRRPTLSPRGRSLSGYLISNIGSTVVRGHASSGHGLPFVVHPGPF